MINEANKKIIENYPEYWIKKKYKSGEVLITEGEKVTYNYYIETGIVKASVIDEKTQKEGIINFFKTGEIIITYRGDAYESKKALADLEVVKGSVVHRIAHKDWEVIRKDEPILIDKLLQKHLSIIINRLIFQVKVNCLPRAEQRYNRMLEYYPFLKELKDDEVSKLLGVDVRTITNIKPDKKTKAKK